MTTLGHHFVKEEEETMEGSSNDGGGSSAGLEDKLLLLCEEKRWSEATSFVLSHVLDTESSLKALHTCFGFWSTPPSSFIEALCEKNKSSVNSQNAVTNGNLLRMKSYEDEGTMMHWVVQFCTDIDVVSCLIRWAEKIEVQLSFYQQQQQQKQNDEEGMNLACCLSSLSVFGTLDATGRTPLHHLMERVLGLNSSGRSMRWLPPLRRRKQPLRAAKAATAAHARGGGGGEGGEVIDAVHLCKQLARAHPPAVNIADLRGLTPMTLALTLPPSSSYSSKDPTIASAAGIATTETADMEVEMRVFQFSNILLNANPHASQGPSSPNKPQPHKLRQQSRPLWLLNFRLCLTANDNHHHHDNRSSKPHSSLPPSITPLYLALLHGRCPQTIHLLLQCGALCNYYNTTTKTLSSSSSGSTPFGANDEWDSISPLHVAAMVEAPSEILSLLINELLKQPNINNHDIFLSKDICGLTPVDWLWIRHAIIVTTTPSSSFASFSTNPNDHFPPLPQPPLLGPQSSLSLYHSNNRLFRHDHNRQYANPISMILRKIYARRYIPVNYEQRMNIASRYINEYIRIETQKKKQNCNDVKRPNDEKNDHLRSVNAAIVDLWERLHVFLVAMAPLPRLCKEPNNSQKEMATTTNNFLSSSSSSSSSHVPLVLHAMTKVPHCPHSFLLLAIHHYPEQLKIFDMHGFLPCHYAAYNSHYCSSEYQHQKQYLLVGITKVREPMPSCVSYDPPPIVPVLKAWPKGAWIVDSNERCLPLHICIGRRRRSIIKKDAYWNNDDDDDDETMLKPESSSRKMKAPLYSKSDWRNFSSWVRGGEFGYYVQHGDNDNDDNNNDNDDNDIDDDDIPLLESSSSSPSSSSFALSFSNQDNNNNNNNNNNKVVLWKPKSTTKSKSTTSENKCLDLVETINQKWTRNSITHVLQFNIDALRQRDGRTKLFPFMQAAAIEEEDANLETIFMLLIADPSCCSLCHFSSC